MRRILIGVAVLATLAVVGVLAWGSVSNPVEAGTDCSFTIDGATWYLDGDCTTDATILIPDGITLNGSNYTITAVDPDGGHFKGAIVMNDGVEAHVTHLSITADSLSNVCDGGADRLRGIMFEGARGSILHSNVYGVNQGASGCQEGNSIEVRNAPFDGTHPSTMTVEVAHNTVLDYQKTGVVFNGDVEGDVHHNKIGSSATQENLAPNSVQFGYGAMGSIYQNHIVGNQWLGASIWAATAVLLYDSVDVEVSQNNIRGNSEIGIYNYGIGSEILNNKVFDVGEDEATHNYDYGIGNWGEDSTVKNNKVRGFDVPYDGVLGGKNKVIQGPQPVNDWF